MYVFQQKTQGMTVLEKYIWIVNTLYNKGERVAERTQRQVDE